MPNPQSVMQFAQHLEVGPRVLDMGCGIGILSALAFERGAQHVTGVDVNPLAIEETRKLAPTATVLVSDLFEHVEGRFDTVVFNVPWGVGVVRTNLDRATFDYPALLDRFFAAAPAHLERGGRLWIQYGEALPGRLAKMLELATQHRFVSEQSWSDELRSISTEQTWRIELHRMRHAT